MNLYNIFQRAALLSVLTTMLAFNSANAQIPTDSIVADFNEFVRLLEETHPDPYTNYGGKPFFRLEAMDTRFGLIEDSVTSSDELARRITKFLAPLEDGHTNIDMGFSSFFEEREPEMGAPIDFRPISDGVVINSITSEYKDLLGSRLIAIEGIPLKEICTNLAEYRTAENEIGRINLFCFINGLSPNELRKAIPDMRQDSITFKLQTPEGKQMNLTLPLIDKYGSGSNIELSSVELTKPFPSQGNLSYLFVDDKKNTMYFRSSQIISRDALEIMINRGMDVGQYLKRTYMQFNEDDMPNDVNKALAKIPSFSDEFGKMLHVMKKSKSKNLIIDLRGNSGGFTPITLPTLYQLWGDKYLEEAPRFGIKFIQLFSPLYMKKMNITMEQLNAEMQDYGFILGDYIATSEGDYSPEEITDEYRDRMIEEMTSSVKDKLMAQHGKPVYTPEHVYVLINPTTYSAAFHYAFFLWKMGATIVGLPSKQAPNTYMEATPFELPRTNLKGNISNSLQLFMPNDDPRAHQFTPDLMPTYEDYKHYNFDMNTELLFLLDYIKNQE
jgi:hypothetical protein